MAKSKFNIRDLIQGGAGAGAMPPSPAGGQDLSMSGGAPPVGGGDIGMGGGAGPSPVGGPPMGAPLGGLPPIAPPAGPPPARPKSHKGKPKTSGRGGGE